MKRKTANDYEMNVETVEPVKLDDDFQLNDDQIEQFREQGFLSIEQVSTQEDVAFVRELYDQLFESRSGWDEGNQFDLGGVDEEGKPPSLPQILNPAKYEPRLKESLILKNITTIAKQLLGPEVKTSIGHAIFKPAGHGSETPWHQDASYWAPNMIHGNLSFWVPLQPATLDNGCMHFVPNSHTYDVVEHQAINNDPRIHGLEVFPPLMGRYIKEVKACPLPPGGCTIHNGYTFHYAPPNRSDIPRRALIFGGSVPGEERKLPRRFPWLEERQTLREQRAEEAGVGGQA